MDSVQLGLHVGLILGEASRSAPSPRELLQGFDLASQIHLFGWIAVLIGVVALGGGIAGVVQRGRRRTGLRQKELELLEEQIEMVRKERELTEARDEGWKGFANFVVVRKVPHGESGICSFYLKPKDKRLKLPDFFPGQHLVFQLPLRGEAQPLTRRYSLSDAPNGEYYRISVKRVGPPPKQPELPPGRGSNFLHDEVEDQETNASRSHLLVAAPQGSFRLVPTKLEPVVLIGGGVGLTPMVSMFNAILSQNIEREVWFFYGVGNSSEDILFEQGILDSRLHDLLEQHSNLHLIIAYSRPLERDMVLLEGNPERYKHGRVGVPLFKSLLPSSNYRYYICGPNAMMDQITEDLEAWGVPEDHIHSERFGPPPKRKAAQVGEAKISFQKSGKEIDFGGEDGCLLDAAERAGVGIASDCRAGACGTCQVGLASGKVTYPQKPSFTPGAGQCLACCAVPAGDVTVDC